MSESRSMDSDKPNDWSPSCTSNGNCTRGWDSVTFKVTREYIISKAKIRRSLASINHALGAEAAREYHCSSRLMKKSSIVER